MVADFCMKRPARSLRNIFDVMTENQFKAYKSKWDPWVYLPSVNSSPVLIGSNDGAFRLIYGKNRHFFQGEEEYCAYLLPVSMVISGHQKEIFAFADAVTGKGGRWCRWRSEEADGLAAVELSMDRGVRGNFCFISPVWIYQGYMRLAAP